MAADIQEVVLERHLETMSGDIKKLAANQDALQSFLEAHLPKAVN